ncbi:MAG: hypothetical protein UT05_C0009G0080 [Parcubacteria group bacterium GW2011_GWF2_38_76]|nr:MAG: hypothetical protein UT05_C0009G0080 [Parcubacteria group bacterium GW2011_GWF2_38_76]
MFFFYFDILVCMNLNVKFELNKELDKKMAFKFLLSSKVGGGDFSIGVTRPHPELLGIKEKDKKEATELINEYFDKYYENNVEILEKEKKELKEKWSKIEGKFIIQLNKIFKNPTPPEGKYIGYLSTIDCNPRFLNDKTFQVFRHRGMPPDFMATQEIVMHEILHFFFYDYAVKKYPEIFDGLDMNKGIFWKLAELFNDVIISLPEFVELHKITKVGVYPDHKKYVEPMKNIWNNNPDIDKWIIKAYEYLNSEK